MSRFLTLNLGAAKATLAEYALNGKKLTLTAYGEGDVAMADADAAGALDATLTPVLHEIMRAQGIKPAPLVLSLNGQMVFPRFAKLPATRADKLDELVQYEVEQNVPFPIDEIVCDHQFLGETPEGDQAVMIVAAKHEQVSQVTDAVRAAGLEPQIVDVAPMAIYNALRAGHPDLGGCTVVLDIGSKSTNLILVEDEKIYNRSIPVAGNTITKELAQTFGCSLEEAEQLKLERAYVSMGGVTENEDEVSERVAKVVRTVLTRLHAEISRSINFYRSQQGGSAPARMFLTGGSVRLPQLDAFFRETLQIDVDFLNPFDFVGVGGKVDRAALENDAFTLVESAGLALRMADRAAVKINLLPPELVAHARNMRRIPFVVTGALGILLALAGGVLVQSRAGTSASLQVEAVRARNEALKGLEKKLQAAVKESEDASAKSDAFQKLLRSRADALLRLKAVRESLVPGMWIVKWEETPVKEGEDGPGGAVVTVRGWTDAMAKAEAAWSANNGGKTSTAAEIVAAALKTRPVFVGDMVKIETQRVAKEFLREFSIRLAFAETPSLAGASPRKSGKKNGKGTR